MEIIQETITTPNRYAPLTVREENNQGQHQVRPDIYRVLATCFLYGAIAFTGGYAFAGLEDFRTTGSAFTALISGVAK